MQGVRSEGGRRSITQAVWGIWSVEDIFLLLLPPLTVLLARLPLAKSWVDVVGSHLMGRLGLFFLVEVGVWIVLASRLPEDLAHPGAKDIWSKMHLVAALVGLVCGVPLLFLLLTHGDWGHVYLFAGAHFLSCAIALVFARKPGAREYGFEARRWLFFPFFVVSTYFTCRLLTAKFLFEDSQLALMKSHIVEMDSTGLLLDGFQVFFLGLLFVFPYIILVVFPRIVAGSLDGPFSWLRRFLGFALSLCLCLAGLLIFYG